MKKQILFICFSLITTINAHVSELCKDKQNQNQNMPTSPKFDLANNNKQHITQQVTIIPAKNDPTDCTIFTGAQLYECMQSQTPENFKKNLMAFNHQKGKNFWLNINMQDYQEAILHIFKSEAEWKAYYNNLSPEYREQFPESLHVQRYFLKRIYINAYYSNIFSLIWSGQSCATTHDLEKFIDAYNAARLKRQISDSRHKQLLNEFDLILKHLFNKKFK
jgi:hypothetical protein